MSTAELKSNLHRLIVETDDISILKKIQDAFTSLRSEPVQGDTLSDHEKKMIDLGLKDIEEGNVVSNEEVKGKFKTWLKEKNQ